MGSGLHLEILHESSLAAVGEAVHAAAIARGLRPERATRLEALVEELVRESLHREAITGEELVSVDLSFDGTELVATVRDHRLPLLPEEGRRLPSRRLAQMGFADRFAVGFDASAGNVVEAAALLVADPDEPAPLAGHDVDEEGEAALVGAIEIRAMVAADAAGLVRLVYRCYGYSYPDDLLYDPARIRRALASGRLHSVVAVLPDGEVVGHLAYAFEDKEDRSPESGRLVVDPRLRGHHLSERLGSARNEVGRLLDIPGAWAKAVTNHDVSQRLSIAFGAVEVGMLLGDQPSAVLQVGLPNPDAGWRSLMLTYRAFGELEARDLHVPAHLEPLLGELRDRLGIERPISTEPVAPDSARSRLTSALHAAHGTAVLRVRHIGSDLRERLHAELLSLANLRPGVVLADLPVNEPAGAWAALQAEALGFSFAGWIPELGREGDVLRMQRIGDHPVDLESIVCARAEGERIKDFCIAEWRRVRRSSLGS